MANSYELQDLNNQGSSMGYVNPGYLNERDDVFREEPEVVDQKKKSKIGLKWVVLVVMLPLITLIALSVAQLTGAGSVRDNALDAQDALLHIKSVQNFVAQTQLEMDGSSRFITTSARDESARQIMASARTRVDSAKDYVVPWPRSNSSHHPVPTRDKFEDLLNNHRKKVDDLDVTFTENTDFYTSIKDSIMRAALASAKLGRDKRIWIPVQQTGYLMLAPNPLGLLLIKGLFFLDSCSRTKEDLIRFLQLDGEQQFLIDFALFSHPAVSTKTRSKTAEMYKEKFINSDLGRNIRRDKDQMQLSNFTEWCQTKTAAEIADVKAAWTTDFEAYFKLLKELTDKLLEGVEAELNAFVDEAEDEFFIYIMVVTLFAMIAIYVACWQAYHIYTMIKNIHAVTDVLETRSVKVRLERKRSELLLCQILPPSLVENLKNGQNVPVETFYSTTIAYLDIVGFVALVVEHTPIQVVEILNNLYGMFDNIVESHHVQKIEQNNDVYCVASGVPRITKEHAVEIANFLIEILGRLEKFTVKRLPNVRIKCRIGAHSGPCAAGIVGRTIPRYSVFGETVKIASRMSRTGEVMKIQISEAMKTNLEHQNRNNYKLVRRGEIDVYGKGKMKTYFLLRQN